MSGFSNRLIYEYIATGRSGRLATIKCAIDRKRNQAESDLHAFRVASKIFNLIINPDDEDAEKNLYQEFDYNMVEQVQGLHKDLEIDLSDPYLIVRMKHKEQWVKAMMEDGNISRMELATMAAVRDRNVTGFARVGAAK